MNLGPDGQRSVVAGPVVVVVNFGSHALIETNLQGEDDPVAAVAEVIVVDNFHSETERVAIATVCREHDWQLVAEPANLGFGAAVNAGIRAAGGRGFDQILLVNPDAVLTGATARALADQLRTEPMTLISPRIVTSAGTPYFHGSRVDLRTGRMRSRPRPGPDTPAKLYPDGSTEEPRLRDWISGACMAFSLELWRAAGGWSERYFLYWEDVDFSQRCVEAGGRLCIRNDLVVVHDEGATHGEQRSRARSTTYYFYNCRNRLEYAVQHLDGRGRLRWALHTPAESVQILLRGGRRQILTSPSTLGSAVNGSLAGLVRLVAGRDGRSRRQ